jgi:WS/DGAT/MGAT family acyltransferase
MNQPMSRTDNFWLSMDEPTNLMIITAFMVFEEPVDIRRLRATIDSRLSVFPRFRMRVVRPVPGVTATHWERDPDFDVRSHVHRLGLPAPGDKAALQELVSAMMNTPLDAGKPLWDVHLIENYGTGCVVLFRIHHCIADGIALIHVLLAAADREAEAPRPGPEAPQPARSAPPAPLRRLTAAFDNVGGILRNGQQLGARLVSESGRLLTDPARMVEMAADAYGMASHVTSVLGRLAVLPPDPHTPFKGRLGTRKRAVWSDPFALEEIKALGRAIAGATVNDVLIATVTGAMRLYLKSRHTRVNELDLRVMVPVNVRKPGTEFELGNKFSTVVLQLPVYIADPVLRLKEVRRRMDLIKRSPEPYVVFGTLSALGFLPPRMSKAAARFFASKTSGVLTNVPGPREPLYFAGSRIANMMFWVPRSATLGLGISILSYAGRVTVGIAADERLMPDPEVLLRGFEQELTALAQRIRAGRVDEEPLVLHDRYRETADSGAKSGPGRNRCRALTRRGTRCRRNALPEGRYCRTHAPTENAHTAPETPTEAEERLRSIARLLEKLAE